MSKTDPRLISKFNTQFFGMQQDQGWDVTTVRELALDFIRQNQATRDAFLAFAYQKAVDECAMGGDEPNDAPELEGADEDARFGILPAGLTFDPNVKDLLRSIADEELTALIDENAGGIVAYVMTEDRAVQIANALNASPVTVEPEEYVPKRKRS